MFKGVYNYTKTNSTDNWTDQTHPVALPPSELVVEGILPSDQTHPVALPPSELVVEGILPSDQSPPTF